MSQEFVEVEVPKDVQLIEGGRLQSDVTVFDDNDIITNTFSAVTEIPRTSVIEVELPDETCLYLLEESLRRDISPNRVVREAIEMVLEVASDE